MIEGSLEDCRYYLILVEDLGYGSAKEMESLLEEVSKLLGHESIRTTEKHYSKWMKGRQDRLDALVRGTWEAA